MSGRPTPAKPRWALALAFAAAGCGTVEARTVAFRTPSPPTSRVDLYVGKVPDRPYYEVGLVQAVGTGMSADEASVLHALRERATRMGCDAVVRVGVENGQTAAHAIGVCARWAGAETARGAPVAGREPPRGADGEGAAQGVAPIADEQERR